MAEIADAADEHRRIVDYATAREITVLPVGTDLYGIEPTADPIGALGALGGDAAVLVKGSRVAGLERVAHALLA
jgi:UDP-N-acetylmuramoyl-tripeptide--D-alanyl-D-alanine ligase